MFGLKEQLRLKTCQSSDCCPMNRMQARHLISVCDLAQLMSQPFVLNAVDSSLCRSHFGVGLPSSPLGRLFFGEAMCRFFVGEATWGEEKKLVLKQNSLSDSSAIIYLAKRRSEIQLPSPISSDHTSLREKLWTSVKQKDIE